MLTGRDRKRSSRHHTVVTAPQGDVMNWPRVRFTTRIMMAAVAVLAVLLGSAVGLRRRSEAFHRRALDYLAAREASIYTQLKERVDLRRAPTPLERAMLLEYVRLAVHCEGLAIKYERAADRPWLPVRRDPPTPTWPEGIPRSRHFEHYIATFKMRYLKISQNVRVPSDWREPR